MACSVVSIHAFLYYIGFAFLSLFWTNKDFILTDSTKAKAFSFASYYGDHMVLQKGPQLATVWGYSKKDGDNITVRVSGEAPVHTMSYVGPISSVPVWKVQLAAVNAGGPYNIVATSSEGTISLRDVLFGDVWLCSGQSNMQFTIPMGFNATEELADTANHHNIRVFTVYPKGSTHEKYDLLGVTEGWSVPSKASIGNPKTWEYFSAVCWLYGKYLQEHLKYPIGLLATSYGGTRVEAWSAPKVLKKCGVDEGNEAITGSPDPNAASVLWNAMVHPLLNMTIYGAIWYQGESNALPSTTMDKYNCTFPSMIDDWRDKFHDGSTGNTNPSFPFGFVQLGANRNDPSLTSGFTNIRWHQTADVGHVPNARMKNVFMAVAMDLPDFFSPWGCIHPRDKQDVSMRLCTAGLAVAYNMTQYSKLNGPVVSNITIYLATKTIQVAYDNAKTTLELRAASGFEVVCATMGEDVHLDDPGTIWLPLPVASHDNTSVTLLTYSKVCPQTNIGAMRYAWRESPCYFKKCAVYNKLSGYPSPPFIVNIRHATTNPHVNFVHGK